MPRSLYAVGMRSSVNINHCGIFLAGVEVGRLYHTPVQIGHTVLGLYTTALEDGLIPSFPRIGGRLQKGALTRLGISDSAGTGYIGLLPGIYQPQAILRKFSLMDALPVIQQSALLGLYAEAVDIAL